MHIDYFLDIFHQNSNRDAIIWEGQSFSYKWLLKRYHHWLETLDKYIHVDATVVVIEADFSPNSIALLFALIEKNSIIVPLTDSVKNKKDDFIKISEGELIIKINSRDKIKIDRLQYNASNKLYEQLKNKKRPGLVLFSSGSTGKSKAFYMILLFYFRNSR